MIYSHFYQRWIATCMSCNLALITPATNVNHDKFLGEYIDKKYYNYQFLKKYFIISKDMYEARCLCGYCFNINCRSYMLNQ